MGEIIMEIFEAIKERHSVRQYKDHAISNEAKTKLEELIRECNNMSGLNMQLVCDDPECFNSFLAHYGHFKNANNYIALVGNKNLKDLEQLCGYYGQKLVIAAQMLGLNTCWVAGTYKKGKCKASLQKGEKILCVIAIGYGETQGQPHKSKSLEKLCNVSQADRPEWFEKGLKAALLAPTAINQQKFFITLDKDEAVITSKSGPMTQIDLGIVKYNFEAASGHKCR